MPNIANVNRIHLQLFACTLHGCGHLVPGFIARTFSNVRAAVGQLGDQHWRFIGSGFTGIQETHTGLRGFLSRVGIQKHDQGPIA